MKRPPKYLLLGLVGLIVLWAPLPMGSNRAWSVGLLAIALAACLPLVAWTFWGDLLRRFRMIAVPLLGFVIVFGYIQLQAALGFGDLDDLIKAELGLAAGAMIFLISFMLAAAKESYARALLYGFLLVCVAYSAYGLLEGLTPDTPLLWFDTPPQDGKLASTFINRNSFATYAGLGLVVSFALLLMIPRLRSFYDIGIAASGRDGSSKDLNMIVFLLIAICITATALLLTQSRAGIVAAGASCFVYSLLRINWKQFQWRMMFVSVAPLVLLFGVLLPFSGSGFLTRLGEDDFVDPGRLHLFEATANMIADRPILGHGFGSFETTLPAFRPEAMPPFPDYDKAHNGYLEVVAALGIPMGALFLSLFGWMAWRFARGLVERRQGRIYPRLGLALTVLVTLHSLVDFSLQIPAVGVSYAFLMGICVAQSYPSRERKSS